MVQIGRDGGHSTAANKAKRSDRGPRQATSITIVTARNSAVNSMLGPRCKRGLSYTTMGDSNSTIPEWIRMPITIYGIKNCDTMKKARAWLDSTASPTTSTTTRRPASTGHAQGLGDELGWEMLLNRAGTTFRKLPDGDKVGLDERKAVALMLAQPSMIKRPVLDLGGKLLVGFKPEIYAEVKPAAGSRARRKLLASSMTSSPVRAPGGAGRNRDR